MQHLKALHTFKYKKQQYIKKNLKRNDIKIQEGRGYQHDSPSAKILSIWLYYLQLKGYS